MDRRLTWTDAWFIAALTETSRASEPMQLWEFVNNADWLNRALPTFDEARFSFARLVDAGYLIVSRDTSGGLRLRGTDAAFDLKGHVTSDTLGGVLIEMATLVGAPRSPYPEGDDQSLGPLEGFEEADWVRAVTRNADWMTTEGRQFLPGFLAPGSSRDIRRR